MMKAYDEMVEEWLRSKAEWFQDGGCGWCAREILKRSGSRIEI